MHVRRCNSPKKHGEFGVSHGIMVNLFQNLFLTFRHSPTKTVAKTPFPQFEC